MRKVMAVPACVVLLAIWAYARAADSDPAPVESPVPTAVEAPYAEPLSIPFASPPPVATPTTVVWTPVVPPPPVASPPSIAFAQAACEPVGCPPWPVYSPYAPYPAPLARRPQLAELHHLRIALQQKSQELAELRREAEELRRVVPPRQLVVLKLQCARLDLDRLADLSDASGQMYEQLAKHGLAHLVASGEFAKRGISSNLAAPNGLAKLVTTTDVAEVYGPIVEDESRFEALLAKLVDQEVLTSLANPTLMIANGEEAELTVVRQIPITAPASEAGPACTDFLTLGTEVHVRTEIRDDQTIRLQLHIECSQPAERKASASDQNVSVLRQTLKTTLELPANRTAVIGGLVEAGGPHSDSTEFVILVTLQLVGQAPTQNAAPQTARGGVYRASSWSQ